MRLNHLLQFRALVITHIVNRKTITPEFPLKLRAGFPLVPCWRPQAMQFGQLTWPTASTNGFTSARAGRVKAETMAARIAERRVRSIEALLWLRGAVTLASR